MKRITQKDLEYTVERINEITSSPKTSWTRTKTVARLMLAIIILIMLMAVLSLLGCPTNTEESGVFQPMVTAQKENYSAGCKRLYRDYQFKPFGRKVR